MLKLIEKTAASEVATAKVILSVSSREKSRLRVTLQDGREAGIFLPRGESLQHGDKLRSESGEVIEVQAANESLSRAKCDSEMLFARACYHLGNRHVPLQIGMREVSYLHDHVLDDMLRGFGIAVDHIEAPFNPEAGAYGGHGHSHDHHGHDHGHDDSHSHSHDHGHSHGTVPAGESS